MPTQDQVDAAALQLAISARELLGLPVTAHTNEGGDDDCGAEPHGASASRPYPEPYRPPTLPASSVTALTFAQKLASPSPLLFTGQLQDRKALRRWKEPGYLAERMGSKKVKVAVTPDGRADDIKKTKQGETVFALPAEVEMTFADLMAKINAQSSSQAHASSSSPPSPIYYLQSQDSNLTDPSTGAGDLSPLLADLLDADGRSDVQWASEGIGSEPEAVNVWVGGSSSRSSMHRDHYENLFYVVRGSKTFTVFPPYEAHFLCEDPNRPFPVHRHAAEPPYELVEEKEVPPTPWIPIDPTLPPRAERNRGYARYGKGLKPLSITVREGEMLFLPAGWYHHVSQQADQRSEVPGQAGGVCVAVNWWYESQAAFGPQWAMLDFIKVMGEEATGQESEGEQGTR